MRNPFRRQERADATASLLRAYQLVLQRGAGAPEATAIAEIIAREYRAAGEEVISPHPALTPEIMGDALDRLGIEGEYVALIDFDDAGEISLVEATTTVVRGLSTDLAQAVYDLCIPTPSGTIQRTVLGSGVVHLRYAIDPHAPWRGIGPLQRARATAEAIGGGEQRIAEELGSAVGFVIPVPQAPGGDDDDDDTADPLAPLAADLAEAKGATLLVESTSSGWGDGPVARPMAEWAARRIGADPPAALQPLRRDVQRTILAAAGVAPDLVHGQTVVGAQLNYLRRDFRDNTIQPLLRRIEVELLRKLGPTATLAIDLPVGDVLMRAKALQALVAADVPLNDARRIARVE